MEEGINQKQLTQEEGYLAKAKVFLDKSLPVHIITTKGEWINGYILEIESSFFMVNEFVKGELPVFFAEIARLEKYKPLQEAR